MELLLNGDMTIKEVNRAFQKKFPCLKLEFFKSNPLSGKAVHPHERYSAGTRLGDIPDSSHSTAVEFNPDNTVYELEQKFLTHGFFVRLFRRSNDVWQETTQSSHLELHRQNAVGLRRFAPTYNTYTLFL